MPTIIVALLAIAFGLWGLSVWWWAVVELLRGLGPILLIVFGMVALASGISGMRDKSDLADEDYLIDDD